MKTSGKIRNVFAYLFAGIGLLGVILLMAFNSTKQLETNCGSVDITLDNNQDVFFLETTDIESIINKNLPKETYDGEIRTVNLSEVESAIEQNPFVAKADMFIDMQGNMHVQVSQKQPIARIINKNGVNYYIEKTGKKFPVNNKFTSRVIVINGQIDEDLKNPEILTTPTLQQAFSLVNYIQQHELWNAQIEQIYVNEQGEFELIPKLGDHTILFGGIDNMEEKFDKLELFYKEGLNFVGWDKYKTINLMYDQQVVCTKKETL